MFKKSKAKSLRNKKNSFNKKIKAVTMAIMFMACFFCLQILFENIQTITHYTYASCGVSGVIISLILIAGKKFDDDGNESKSGTLCMEGKKHSSESDEDFRERKGREAYLQAIKDSVIATIADEKGKDGLSKEKLEALEAFKSDIEAIKDLKEFGTYKQTLADLAAEFKAFKETAKENVVKNIRASIKEAVEVNAEHLKTLKSSKKGMVEIEVKSAQTVVTSGITPVTAAQGSDLADWHEGGRIGQIPYRKVFLRNLFKSASASKEYVKIYDQATVVRNAQMVADIATAAYISTVTWKVEMVQISKCKDMINISLDMLDDYDFVSSEVQNLLNSSLALKIDSELLTGSGAYPELNSVAAVASTFSATNVNASLDYHAAVDSPQLIDLLSIMGAQIKTLGQNNAWMPSAALVNPRDFQMMKLLKDNQKNYIKANQNVPTLFVDANNNYYVDGILVIENPNITADTCYMADFSKGTVYTRPGIGIEFSYENATNFETETVTVKVFERLNLVIRNVDVNAFMVCNSIAAALTALTKPIV